MNDVAKGSVPNGAHAEFSRATPLCVFMVMAAAGLLMMIHLGPGNALEPLDHAILLVPVLFVAMLVTVLILRLTGHLLLPRSRTLNFLFFVSLLTLGDVFSLFLVITSIGVLYEPDLDIALLSMDGWPKVVYAGVIVNILILWINGLANRVRQQTRLSKEVNLQALQSRIRPHFLFNSMNSVASLIRSEPEQAEKALEDLADVFRVVLADPRKMVPLAAEIEVARQYLDIESIRLGDRLRVEWTDINAPGAALIPSLTLQPLLENSIYHGIEPNFGGGTVSAEIWQQHGHIQIIIGNPLPEILSQARHRERSNKIALDNVRERLDQHFHGLASLQTLTANGKYYVRLAIPLIYADPTGEENKG